MLGDQSSIGFRVGPKLGQTDFVCIVFYSVFSLFYFVSAFLFVLSSEANNIVSFPI